MIIKSRTALRDKNQVRSFIGISIPFDLSRKIYANLKMFSSENRNFVYSNIEQMHITLQFLGESVSEDSLEQISNALRPLFKEVDQPLIRTGGLRFGHKSQIIPTVLFLEVIPSEELKEITERIHYAIKSLSLPDVRREKDYKRLIYHITLGRAKHHVSRNFGRKILSTINANEIPEYEFRPESISILNSRFTIKGHKYSNFADFQFKKNI